MPPWLSAISRQLSAATELLCSPASPLQWGVSLLSLGFALLLAGLAINWRLACRSDDPG